MANTMFNMLMSSESIKNMSDDELNQLCDNWDWIKSIVDSEQKKREKRVRKEKYKDVIGKYFKYKLNDDMLIQVIDIKEDESEKSYIVKQMTFSNTFFTSLLPHPRCQMTFLVDDEYWLADLTGWEQIDKDEAEHIVKGWRDDAFLAMTL